MKQVYHNNNDDLHYYCGTGSYHLSCVKGPKCSICLLCHRTGQTGHHLLNTSPEGLAIINMKLLITIIMF